MKICPTCQKTYPDDTLNFCLNDGAVLNPFDSEENSQATVYLGQAPQTNPVSGSQHPTSPNFGSGSPTMASSNIPPVSRGLSNSAPPRTTKKSRAWIWVLAIFGVLVVVGGIGFIGIVALVATNMDESDNSETGNKLAEKSPTPVVFKNVKKDDFSNWRVEKNQFGTTELRGGEYIMSSKQLNYYYVLVATDKSFDTFNASTKIIVRNVNGTQSNSGYGILIHCDGDNPLGRDFGFLIDSSKQSFRVVQHTDKKEDTVVKWTRFPSIRSGTQTNELEVKDQNGKMSFYINGQFAASVDNTTDYQDGVYGLYVSDAIPIAFSDLRIGK